MSRVAVIVPVLGRPSHIRPLLEAFARTTPSATLTFVASPGDEDEQAAIKACGARMVVCDGGFAAKCNAAIPQTTEEFVLVIGDDVEPLDGWYEAALKHITDTIQVIGIPDGIERPSRPEHACHFLMTRAASELPTFDGGPGPFHAGYVAWYPDDEYMASSQWRGNYTFADVSATIRHLHPMVGLSQDDATYAKGRASQHADGRIFQQRMSQLHRLPAPAPHLDVTIGIATFGGQEWIDLAHTRAIPSAAAQGARVIYRHEATLQDARNAVLADCETEFLINLDADDELAPGYTQAMAKGTADLRAPRVRCIRDGHVDAGSPFMPRIGNREHRRGSHQCTGACLPLGNWLVCGTCARTELLRAVGGWWAEELYEDWSLWLRCWKHGCTVEPIMRAIYVQHLSFTSRNHTGAAYERREEVHDEIIRSIYGEEVPVP